nr:hypothetical protein [Borreliella garinii]
MNAKPYFPYLYHYLFNHESIKSLSAIEKEIEMLSYLKENKKTITTFIKNDFESELKDLIQYIKDKTDAMITPFVLSGIEAIDFNIVKPLFTKELTKNDLNLIFNFVKANSSLRKEFFYNFNTISNGYITFYINKLFEGKNSYTIYLIQKENKNLYSSDIIKNYIKILLLLKVLVIKYCFEKGIELTIKNIESTSKAISNDTDFLDEKTARLIIESFFKYETLQTMSPISTLIAIFSARARIPKYKNNPVKGFIGYDESWFSIKQSGSREYDSRIIKELLEIAKGNKW